MVSVPVNNNLFEPSKFKSGTAPVPVHQFRREFWQRCITSVIYLFINFYLLFVNSVPKKFCAFEHGIRAINNSAIVGGMLANQYR
jgi:hypothetical protein